MEATSTAKKRPRDKNAIWAEILSESSCKEDFLVKVMERQPLVAATRRRNLNYFADHYFKVPPVHYTPSFTIFTGVPPEAASWVEQNILVVNPSDRLDRPTSLVIEGPSGIGKTEWARSLGRHNYYNGGVDFSRWDDEAVYTVIDNIRFNLLPCWKQILGCKSDFTVNEKYRKLKLIKGGKPVIVLCNEDMSYYHDMQKEHALSEWAKVNCTFVTTKHKFY